jgi:FkbM family methyltransferase
MSEPHIVGFDAHGRHVTLRFADPADHIARTIEQAHCFYEAELLADIRSRLFFAQCAIDVGAHVGNHTLYFASVLGLRTISFEPNPQSFALLRANVDENGCAATCELHQQAVGSEAGHVRLVEVPQTNSGMTQVETDTAGTIESVRLDDVLADEARIDIIKIDVEGFELEVIEGAKTTIGRHRPLLYVEVMAPRFDAVRDLLWRAQYVPWKRFNATPTFLFLPCEQFGPQRGRPTTASVTD